MGILSLLAFSHSRLFTDIPGVLGASLDKTLIFEFPKFLVLLGVAVRVLRISDLRI